MCVRGASAVQSLLDRIDRPDLRVFVVWEPVIVTDIGPPLTRVLALVRDRRAVQFWDPTHAVSRSMKAAGRIPAGASAGGAAAGGGTETGAEERAGSRNDPSAAPDDERPEGAAAGNRDDDEWPIWDFIAVIPPGTRWESVGAEGFVSGGPVVEWITEIEKAL